MGDSNTRLCSYCASPNKGAHRYCVRCSAPLDATGTAPRPVARSSRAARQRAKRYVVAAGVVVALAAGFMLHALLRATHEVPALTDDVHAANAPAVAAPPPTVAGWVPGGSAPVVEPVAAPAPSSASLPVARPNPYDVPAEPGTSMVGIAPRAPRARAEATRRQAFTNDDLVGTRGSQWSTPAETTSPPAGRSEDVVKRETKLREKLAGVEAAQRRLRQVSGDDRDDALDDLQDAREDAEKAARKLEEARREN